MNSNFNENQIKAYAAAFEAGDAIWCKGEWHEVITNAKRMECDERFKADKRLTTIDGNSYCINRGEENNLDPYLLSFISDDPYRVTTLEDYKLQGGEKLVWLGECIDLTFGEIYVVESDNKHSGGLKVTDDAGDRWLVGSTYFEGLIDWAVIPRYEQVKKNEESKFKKGDKVITPSGGTGTIYKKEMMGSGTVVCTVELIDKDGDCYRSKFREIDLKPYIEEPPASKVEIALDEVAIHSEIITRLVKQTIKGVKKYGDPVQHDNLSTVEWIDHAIDESVDQIVYLTALKHSLLSKEATK